uniref:Uncharacterized protein n=1 Tax=Arundo donax TaxID=35708 RepID=A0A0A9DGN7_ARUDO
MYMQSSGVKCFHGFYKMSIVSLLLSLYLITSKCFQMLRRALPSPLPCSPARLKKVRTHCVHRGNGNTLDEPMCLILCEAFNYINSMMKYNAQLTFKFLILRVNLLILVYGH